MHVASCVFALLCCHTVALDCVSFVRSKNEEFRDWATRERKKSKINSFEDGTAVNSYRIPLHRRIANGGALAAPATVHGTKPKRIKKNKKKYVSRFSGRLHFQLKRTHPHRAHVHICEWNCILHCFVSWYLRRDKKWNHFINFHFIHRSIDTHTHTAPHSPTMYG